MGIRYFTDAIEKALALKTTCWIYSAPGEFCHPHGGFAVSTEPTEYMFKITWDENGKPSGCGTCPNPNLDHETAMNCQRAFQSRLP